MCSFDADKQTPAPGVSEPVADWEQRLVDESAVQSVLMRHCETRRVWIDREQKLVWKCAGCDHSYGVNPHIVPNLADLEYSQVAYHQAAMVLEELGWFNDERNGLGNVKPTFADRAIYSEEAATFNDERVYIVHKIAGFFRYLETLPGIGQSNHDSSSVFDSSGAVTPDGPSIGGDGARAGNDSSASPASPSFNGAGVLLKISRRRVIELLKDIDVLLDDHLKASA